jgi:hypothetical protein
MALAAGSVAGGGNRGGPPQLVRHLTDRTANHINSLLSRGDWI